MINSYDQPYCYKQILQLNISEKYLHLSWSPDNSKLATCDSDKIIIFNAVNGENLNAFNIHTWYDYHQFAWSPDGLKFATSSGAHDVTIWDAQTGAILRVFKGHTQNVSSIAWSPDSKKLASVSISGTIRIWDVAQEFLSCSAATNTEIMSLESKNIIRVEWSLDGSYFGSFSFDNIKIFKINDNHFSLINNILNPKYTAVGFSSDNSEILTIKELKHNNYVLSNDKKKIAVFYDKYIQINDLKSGDLLNIINAKEGVNRVCWSPDNTKLAAVLEDKTLRVWSQIYE